MGSGEIILHRLLRHINAGKIQPLSAQSRNRYAARTEDNDPSENIRGEGRFHSHTLQFTSVCFKVHRCSDWVYCLFPNCLKHSISHPAPGGRWAMGMGRDGPPGGRSVSACIYISHTPASSLWGMRSLSPNRETLTSALKGCWIVYRDWWAFAMGTGQAVRALFESVIRVVQI